MSLTSCDKIAQIKAKAKDLAGVKASSAVNKVTESEAKKIINSESRLVMVKYYLDTCEVCGTMAPVLDRLAKGNAERFRVIKVDASVESAWVQELNIKGVPAFHLYDDGELVDQSIGSIPETDIQKKIDYYSLSPAERLKQRKPEPSIQSLPKNWLPAGVSRG